MREIKILQQVYHDNIVNMKEIIMAQPPDKDVFIVFDYLEHDLAGLLKSPETEGFFTLPLIKGIMYQLICGLNYLHTDAKILHRDIKSSNVLIDRYGTVKLADFGLAKHMHVGYDGHLKSSQSLHLTNRIITLWFRPPEILLGCDSYGPEVDVWSLGCIFAELLLGKPPFIGSDDVTQIEAILTELREINPTAADVLKNYPWFHLLPSSLQSAKFNSPNDSSLRRRLQEKGHNEEMLLFLMKFFEIDPKKRVSCAELLNDPFFAECSSESFKLAYRDCFENSRFFSQELKY